MQILCLPSRDSVKKEVCLYLLGKANLLMDTKKKILGIASTPPDNKSTCSRAELKFSLRDRGHLHGSG